MRVLILATACVLAAGVGCGAEKPKLAPVDGTVSQNGKGLTAGAVYFHPAPGNDWVGEPPSSPLALDGRFTVSTYPHGPGVPPGEWKVALSPALASRIRKPEYGDPAKTPLTLTVPDAGVQNHRIDIP